MTTYKRCWRRNHRPTREAAMHALDELGILSHYDVVRCSYCQEWVWNRRPDFGDAA